MFNKNSKEIALKTKWAHRAPTVIINILFVLKKISFKFIVTFIIHSLNFDKQITVGYPRLLVLNQQDAFICKIKHSQIF